MAAGTRGPKRGGKENAPPASKVVEDIAEVDEFDSIAEAPVKPAKPVKATTAAKGKSKAKVTAAPVIEEPIVEEEIVMKELVKPASAGSSTSQKRIEQLDAENQRLRCQRDQYARQFEELSNLRNTAVESTLEKVKANFENQGKAKDDIISTLTKLNEKLQAKIHALEKTAKSDAPKADPKEIKALKEVVEKTNEDLARRNTEYAELEKMYKTEQQYCQTLQASRSTVPTAPINTSAPSDGSPEDAAIIRLYEDITELNCVDVKFSAGKYGPKDKVLDFNCILTPGQGSSINFRLRTFKELDPAKQAQRAKNPYNAVVLFTPELSRETDQAFISRLGRFQKDLRFMQDELPGMMRELRERVVGGAE